jgi:hypothetical protein
LITSGKEFFQTFVIEAFNHASNCNFLGYTKQHIPVKKHNVLLRGWPLGKQAKPTPFKFN